MRHLDRTTHRVGMLLISWALPLVAPNAVAQPQTVIKAARQPLFALSSTPIFVATLRHQAQLQYTLWQANGSHSYLQVGLSEVSCSYSAKGGENFSSAEHNISSISYCVGTGEGTAEVVLPGEVASRGVKYAEISIGVEGNTGQWTTRKITSCGRDCERETVTINVTSAKATLSSSATTQLYRRAGDVWFLFSTACPVGKASEYLWTYQVLVSNGVTGRVVSVITVPKTPCMDGMNQAVKLSDIPATPEGVPLGQPFKVEIIAQGSLETPRATDYSTRFYGSKIRFGFVPEN